MLKSLHRGWTGIVNVFFWLIGIWPIWILICAAGLISSLRKKE